MRLRSYRARKKSEENRGQAAGAAVPLVVGSCRVGKQRELELIGFESS